MFVMALKDLLKKEMDRRNLSIRNLAKLVGVSHPTIISVLDGNKPSYDTCKKLAPFLHMPLEAVLRAGGLLDPVPSDTECEEQIIYLLRQLPPEEQKRYMELLEFEVERQKKKQPKTKSRGKPPAQSILMG